MFELVWLPWIEVQVATTAIRADDLDRRLCAVDLAVVVVAAGCV